ncbi:MAG: preprotein translocase subunit SecE [Dehalococcoidia bacterium]|nr:preprotein translocase subunit SecE [Dehalococcoidia bacterium]
MTIKTTARPQSPKQSEATGRFRFKRPQFTFAREIVSELRKVTWPTPEQTRDLTIVVVLISLVIGALLGGVDWVFSELARLFLLPPGA